MSLRQNLVDTVYNSWKETGFAWEQYNPETGKGQRTQHFTGWTSLVVKIMGMPDLGESRGREMWDEPHDHDHGDGGHAHDKGADTGNERHTYGKVKDEL